MLEQREKIDTNVLEQVSAILKIPVEAIRNFDEEQVMNIISNTFHSGSFVANSVENYHNNPIEKLIPASRREDCIVRADVEGEG